MSAAEPSQDEPRGARSRRANWRLRFPVLSPLRRQRPYWECPLNQVLRRATHFSAVQAQLGHTEGVPSQPRLATARHKVFTTADEQEAGIADKFQTEQYLLLLLFMLLFLKSRIKLPCVRVIIDSPSKTSTLALQLEILLEAWEIPSFQRRSLFKMAETDAFAFPRPLKDDAALKILSQMAGQLARRRVPTTRRRARNSSWPDLAFRCGRLAVCGARPREKCGRPLP